MHPNTVNNFTNGSSNIRTDQIFTSKTAVQTGLTHKSEEEISTFGPEEYEDKFQCLYILVDAAIAVQEQEREQNKILV